MNKNESTKKIKESALVAESAHILQNSQFGLVMVHENFSKLELAFFKTFTFLPFNNKKRLHDNKEKNRF